MSGVLDGKVALVSGASSGIGLATARLFVDAGATVHAMARRREAMDEGVGEERVASGRFAAHALDQADQPAVERVLGEITSTGSVDVLVVAAGINLPERRLDQLTPQAWDSLVATNLSGAFYLVNACLPALRAARGQVTLIGSVSGSWPDVSGPAYQASKAGLLAFGRAAGFEEHQRGVRFTTIMPGIVNTPILEKRPEPPPSEVREAALQAEDVAAACLFVAGLPPRASVPELTILPTALQALGKTGVASPPVPPASPEAP